MRFEALIALINIKGGGGINYLVMSETKTYDTHSRLSNNASFSCIYDRSPIIGLEPAGHVNQDFGCLFRLTIYTNHFSTTAVG